MTQMGVFGIIIPVDPDGLGMECSMQRFNYPSDWVFMTKLSGGNHRFKVLLDNQAYKNEALVSNIRPNGKARSIGGIDGSQSGMSTEQICDIPYVGVGYFNKNAFANILSWSKCIKLGMNPDYFKASETFVLYASDTTGWVLLVTVRVHMCATLQIWPQLSYLVTLCVAEMYWQCPQ